MSAQTLPHGDKLIRHSEDLDALDRRYARDVLSKLTYSEALERFAALWAEAVRLNPDFPGDWREDIEPDLRIARILNALPGEG